MCQENDIGNDCKRSTLTPIEIDKSIGALPLRM